MGDTGLEPATSSVSRKRANQLRQPPYRSGYRIRTGVYGFAGRCLATRPTHQKETRRNSSPRRFLRADDGTRTRDFHLGKVTLYQLSYIRDVCRIETGLNILHIKTLSAQTGKMYEDKNS